MSRNALLSLLALLPWLAAADDMPAGHHHMDDDPHLKLTAPRAATPEDEARYRALEETIRHDLARYRNVEVAKADGYEQFLPGVMQHEYHFTKKSNGFAAVFGFDPQEPTSLLYHRDADGRFRLTGVMYTAPAFADEAELDARVPLSMARWHQHVNLCVPGPWRRERWTEMSDGRPLFGPKSPIASKDACNAVGGRFVPRLFGWMVHVAAFDRG